MSRHSVEGSIRFWELAGIGEFHEVARASGLCEVLGQGSSRCRGHVRYVWARAGRREVRYCNVHGIDTFPDARNKPHGGRPLPACRLCQNDYSAHVGDACGGCPGDFGGGTHTSDEVKP